MVDKLKVLILLLLVVDVKKIIGFTWDAVVAHNILVTSLKSRAHGINFFYLGLGWSWTRDLDLKFGLSISDFIKTQ